MFNISELLPEWGEYFHNYPCFDHLFVSPALHFSIFILSASADCCLRAGAGRASEYTYFPEIWSDFLSSIIGGVYWCMVVDPFWRGWRRRRRRWGMPIQRCSIHVLDLALSDMRILGFSSRSALLRSRGRYSMHVLHIINFQCSHVPQASPPKAANGLKLWYKSIRFRNLAMKRYIF